MFWILFTCIICFYFKGLCNFVFKRCFYKVVIIIKAYTYCITYSIQPGISSFAAYMVGASAAYTGKFCSVSKRKLSMHVLLKTHTALHTTVYLLFYFKQEFLAGLAETDL